MDVLFPRTDLAVAIQAVVVAVAWLAAYRLARRDRDLRLLAVGGGILMMALFGVRALH